MLQRLYKKQRQAWKKNCKKGLCTNTRGDDDDDDNSGGGGGGDDDDDGDDFF